MTITEQIDLKRAELDAAEAALKPIKAELDALVKKRENLISERIKLAKKGFGNFSGEELIFAATARCSCGAGLAYPPHGPIYTGEWLCSAILQGNALPAADPDSVVHDSGFPFSVYEIKSEREGLTTRQ